jgi:UDP-glucose 6-dehydrogenase
MSFKYNAATLQLIESLFKQNKYVVRYEKGAFQSGYCILQDKRVVVINKFYDTESRINALVEIFQQIELKNTDFDDKQMKIFNELSQRKLEIE